MKKKLKWKDKLKNISGSKAMSYFFILHMIFLSVELESISKGFFYNLWIFALVTALCDIEIKRCMERIEDYLKGMEDEEDFFD